MTSKLQIERLTHDLGQKPYKFVLSEASEGSVTLYYSPNGWMDAETTYTRDKKYGSVLRNASTNELEFFKEGKKFLKNCYENSGIDCDAWMSVSKLDKTTNTYVSYPAAGKFDFSTYQVDEVSVKIQMIDTSFKEKVINRMTTEVDLLGLESIGKERITVAAFPVQEVTMPDTSIDLSDTATTGGGTVSPSGEYVVTMISVTNADFINEMKIPTGSINTILGSFFRQSVTPRTLRITGTITNHFVGTGSIDFTLVHINGAEVVQHTYGVDDRSGTNLDYDFEVDQFITLDTGDSILFQVKFTGTSVLISGDLIVNEIYTGSPEVNVKAFPYYEALLRGFQLTTDTDNPLKSDFLGEQIHL